MTTHKSQKVKATQCPSTDGWINSEVYSRDRILFSLKEKGNSKTYYNRLNLEELSEITPVMLSDIRQSHRKTKPTWVRPLRAGKFTATGSGRAGVRGAGRGRWGVRV